MFFHLPHCYGGQTFGVWGGSELLTRVVQSSFQHTGAYIYSKLEWNGGTPTMVGGRVREHFRIRLSRLA